MVIPILAIVVAGICVAGLALGGLSLFAGSSGKGDTLAAAPMDSLSEATIPPMDAAAPAKIETATFAMG